MGCFRYCDHPGCDRGLDQPTAREDLVDGQFCVHGHKQTRQWQSIEEWVADLDERLQRLES
jgi:hypothetical protein